MFKRLNMYYYVTFLCIIILNFSLQIKSASFPAAKFFNISESEVDNYSHYLCHTDPDKPKCCNCDVEFCRGDCCIDVSWSKHTPSFDIYIATLIMHKDHNDDYGLCLPIMYPLLGNHKSEHFIIVPTYEPDMDCHHPYTNYSLPVLNMEMSTFFISEECAKYDMGYVNLFVNIDVYCRRVFNLTNGQQFTLEMQHQMDDCVFKIDRFDLDDKIGKVDRRKTIYDTWRKKECQNEISTKCQESDSSNTGLCHLYAAPTKNYKNPHCQKCTISKFTTIEPIKNKCDCARGVCPLETFEHDYPVTFKLVHDVEKNVVVKDLQMVFPIKDFFGLELNLKGTNILCSSRAMCCECDADCFKYKSCCMDILWNPKVLLNMTTYKKLLIQRTKKYKDLTCQNLQWNNNRAISFFMVTTCVEDASEKMKVNCSLHSPTDLKTSIPVIGKDGLLYKNLYCAQCNLISVDKVVNISVSWREKYGSVIVRDSTIDITDHKNLRLKKCERHHQNLFVNCPVGHQYHDLCRSYKDGFSTRNVHCELCNNKTISNSDADRCIPHKLSFFRFPVTIRISSNFTVSSVEYEDRKMFICSGSGIDLIIELNRSMCVNAEQTKADYSLLGTSQFDSCMSLYNNFTWFVLVNPVLISKSELSNLIKVTENDLEVFYYSKELVILRVKMKNDSFIFDLLNSYLAKDLRKISFVLHTSRNPIINPMLQIGIQDSFRKGVCRKRISFGISDANFTSNCDVNLTYDNDYDIDDTSFRIVIHNTGKIERYVDFCQEYYDVPKCSALKLIKGNMSYDDSSGAVTNVYSNEKYNMYKLGEYYPAATDGIIICTMSILELTESIIRTTGTLLSIGSYIFFVYVIRKKEKIIHGRVENCILNVIVHLMLVDVLLLSDVGQGLLEVTIPPLICKTIEIITFFGLTILYLSLTALAISMRTFLSNSIDIRPCYRLKYFYLIEFISCAVLTSLAFILDYTNTVDVGFQYTRICKPNNLYGRLYFYIVPGAIFHLITYVLLVKSHRIMKSMESGNDGELNQKKRVFRIVQAVIIVVSLSETVSFFQTKFDLDTGVATPAYESTTKIMYHFIQSCRGMCLLLILFCDLRCCKKFEKLSDEEITELPMKEISEQ